MCETPISYGGLKIRNRTWARSRKRIKGHKRVVQIIEPMCTNVGLSPAQPSRASRMGQQGEATYNMIEKKKEKEKKREPEVWNCRGYPMNGAAEGPFSACELSWGPMAILPVLALPAVWGTIGRHWEGGKTACTRHRLPYHRPSVEAN